MLFLTILMCLYERVHSKHTHCMYVAMIIYKVHQREEKSFVYLNSPVVQASLR